MICLWLIYTALLICACHVIFEIRYIDVWCGIIKEIVIAGLISAILTAATIEWWYVISVIIIMIGLVCMIRICNPFIRKMLCLVIIVLAIAVAIIGRDLCDDGDDDDDDCRSNIYYAQSYERWRF